jgi:ACS family hexuronate transporter-like MFS transporter
MLSTALRWRWVAVSVFVFSAVLNYLDRQILATMVDIWRDPSRPAALSPGFTFSYADYGAVLAAFSIAYAISAPFMGWFLDRAGLNRGMAVSVVVWAIASLGTGTVHSLHQLLFWRTLLGMSEAAGVSAQAKVSAMYLLPEERALGAAAQQLGISIGAGLAPRFTVFFAYHYDWRHAFIGAAVGSLVWIPAWLATARLIPPAVQAPSAARRGSPAALIRDRALWALMAANALGMTLYSLWTNWTPSYLVRVHHLAPQRAANYSWIVPVAAFLGAVSGGGLSWRWIRRGMSAVEARKRACLVASALALVTAFVPALPTPALATAGMSLSLFLVAAWSTNLYTIPVDLYGASRAAFGVSALVFSYGVMQAIVSRPLGQAIDRYGFTPVCLIGSALPLAGSLLVWWQTSERKLLQEPA